MKPRHSLHEGRRQIRFLRLEGAESAFDMLLIAPTTFRRIGRISAVRGVSINWSRSILSSVSI